MTHPSPLIRPPPFPMTREEERMISAELNRRAYLGRWPALFPTEYAPLWAGTELERKLEQWSIQFMR